MLSKVLPEFKLLLPIAAISVSPLLLAAAQPPALDTELEPNGIYCNSATAANVDSQSETTREPAVAPGSIATQNQVLATSQQELATFLANRLATALQLLQSNPYATHLVTPVRADNSSAAESDLSNCLAASSIQTSLQPEIQPDIKLALVPGTSVALALQPSSALTSTASIPTSETFAELPDLSTPFPASSPGTPAAPIPAPLTLPANTPPVPIVQPAPIQSEPPADLLREVQPAAPIVMPPAIAPANDSPSESIDPSNFTPTAVEPTPFNGNLPNTSVSPAQVQSEPPANPVIEAQPAAPITAPPAIAPTNDSPSESVDPFNFTPATTEPTPFDGDLPKTLAAIPDGNYRYIAGEAEERIYSDAELQQRGGAVFVLRKEGTTITGDLLPRLGLAGICITGAVSGDVVSGEAYPYETGSTTAALPEGESLGETTSGETLQPYGSGVLQVQNTTRVEGKGLYYADAVLDLANFSRINVGSTLPPASCSL